MRPGHGRDVDGKAGSFAVARDRVIAGEVEGLAGPDLQQAADLDDEVGRAGRRRHPHPGQLREHPVRPEPEQPVDVVVVGHRDPRPVPRNLKAASWRPYATPCR